MANPYSQWGLSNIGGGGSGGGGDPYSQWGISSSTTTTHRRKKKKRHESHSIGGFFSNVAKDVESTAVGIAQLPQAAAAIGEATYKQIEHPGSHALTRGILEPMAYQTAHDFTLKGLYEHPINAPLDVLGLAGGVGGLALRGTKLGVAAGAISKESRLGRLAKDTRELSFRELKRNVDRPRTIQGRAIANGFDKIFAEGKKLENAPVYGHARRLTRIREAESRRLYLRLHRQAPRTHEAFQRLSHDEKVALVVALPRTPLEHRIDYFRRILKEYPSLAKQMKVSDLERPQVAKLLEHPTPRLLRASHEAHKLDQAEADLLMKTGDLTPTTREHRRFLEQRIIAEKILGGKPTLEWLQNREQDILAGRHTDHISPRFGPAIRFHHTTEAEASAGHYLESASTVTKLGKVAAPGLTKKNEGVLYALAHFSTDPEANVKSFMQTLRYARAKDMQSEFLDKIGLPPLEGELGHKLPSEVWYRKSPDRSTTATMPRELKQRDELYKEIMQHADTQAKRNRLVEHIMGDQPVFKDAEGVPRPAVFEGDLSKFTRQQLEQAGFKRVPRVMADLYREEHRTTTKALRYYDFVTNQLWRPLVLGLEPRFSFNNVVSAHVIYVLNHLGPLGVYNYVRSLLAVEKGDRKVLQLWRYSASVPTFRRKYGAIFQDLVPSIHTQGFYSSRGVQHLGVFEASVERSNVAKLARGVARGGKTVATPLRALVKANYAFSQFFENVSRDATALHYLQTAGVDTRKLEKFAADVHDSPHLLRDAIGSKNEEILNRVEKHVGDVMGDYHSMTPFERAAVRRIFPFYSWFRTIAVISAKFTARHPLRLAIIRHMETFAQDKQSDNLPSWLLASLSADFLLGKPKKGEANVFLSQSANPFGTISQETGLVQSLFQGTGTSGAQGNPLLSINPVVQAVLVGLTGVDPFFKNAYTGPGSKTGGGILPEAAGYFASNIPEYTQMRQLIPGKYGPGYGPLPVSLPPVKSTLYDYAPAHIAGQDVPIPLLNLLGIPARRVKTKRAAELAKKAP